MPFANLEHHRIFYEDTGGDKPVLAFSHGLLMDRTMFAPQIDALRDTWRCISWDERGHGETGQIAELSPFTYWDCARDLANLLAHLAVSIAPSSSACRKAASCPCAAPCCTPNSSAP